MLILKIILQYVLYISCPIFLMVYGLQIICTNRLKTNFIKVSNLPEKRAITLHASLPPIDGIPATFLMSLIPVENIAYLLFTMVLCFCKTDGKIISGLSDLTKSGGFKW